MYEYYFSGLTPGDGSPIIQPVLQWGSTPAGGGGYWAIVCWIVFNSGDYVYSGISEVSSGDLLDSEIYLRSVSGNIYQWGITIADAYNAQSQYLTYTQASGHGALFPDAWPAVHETSPFKVLAA